MCLVALAWKTHPRWPLVLLGNRDEAHARPSATLHPWQDAPILAGRDLQSGGTWMGLGPDGRVAVVTNVRDGLPKPFTGPSRGALPQAFLEGVIPAHTYAQQLTEQAQQYAPFNLIVADATGCAYVGNHPASGAHAIAPGVHALSNGDFDEDWPKTRQLRGVLRQWAEAGLETLDTLWAALADRQIASDDGLPRTGIELALERRLSPAFVHGNSYGTRASTMILIDHAGAGTIIERCFAADGTLTCETRLTA